MGKGERKREGERKLDEEKWRERGWQVKEYYRIEYDVEECNKREYCIS